LAGLGAEPAAAAEILVNMGQISGCGQHRNAALMGLDRTTTAGAAIADGVKTAERGILEKGMMDMAAPGLGRQDFLCFDLAEAAGFMRVMSQDEIDKNLSDHYTDGQGEAMFVLSRPARAIEDSQVVGMLED
jgi:hypothetical protein